MSLSVRQCRAEVEGWVARNSRQGDGLQVLSVWVEDSDRGVEQDAVYCN